MPLFVLAIGCVLVVVLVGLTTVGGTGRLPQPPPSLFEQVVEVDDLLGQGFTDRRTTVR